MTNDFKLILVGRLNHKDVVELVKVFKDNVFVSIKLDCSKKLYYIATMFDVKVSKIETNVKSGRWKKLDEI